MTKKAPPTAPRGDIVTDAEPRSRLREQVRQHMLKMGRFALIAAPPLANTACDPAPIPACEEHYWYTNVSGDASWGQDHGERIVVVDLRVSDDVVHLPSSYTIAGGSLLTSGKSDQLRIKPDAGAEVIVLRGQMTCGAYGSQGIRITIELVPPDGGDAGDYPMVTIDL